MKLKGLLILALAAFLAYPAGAKDKSERKKKNQSDRAMLEKMEAVPCGAKEKGLSGLGSFWASVGITHMSTDEKLCPQYLLRTDDMEYHVRPADYKHAVILPIGQEVVFKIKKDRMFLKVPEGPDHKMRPYQVVSMTQANSDDDSRPTSARSQQ